MPYKKRYSRKMKKRRVKARKQIDKLQNRRISAIERHLDQNGGQLDFSIGNLGFPCVKPAGPYDPGTVDYTTTFAMSLNNMIQQGVFENCRTDQTITLKNMTLRLLLSYDQLQSLSTDTRRNPLTAKVNILIVRYKSKLPTENTQAPAPPTFNPVAATTWDGYDLALQEITRSCLSEDGKRISYCFDDPSLDYGEDRFSYPFFNTQSKIKYEILYNKCHFVSTALSQALATPGGTTYYTPQGFPTQHGATNEKIININLKNKVAGKKVYYDPAQEVEDLSNNGPDNLVGTLGVPETIPQTINRGEIVMYCWSDVAGYGAAGNVVPQVSGHMRVKWN